MNRYCLLRKRPIGKDPIGKDTIGEHCCSNRLLRPAYRCALAAYHRYAMQEKVAYRLGIGRDTIGAGIAEGLLWTLLGSTYSYSTLLQGESPYDRESPACRESPSAAFIGWQGVSAGRGREVPQGPPATATGTHRLLWCATKASISLWERTRHED